MMQEMGFCQGIENYSRHLTGREPGGAPAHAAGFLPARFPLTLIDESHATIPQIGGMYEGDKSRKTVLVEHGFRLPSALDNRPLRFDEFMQMTGQRSMSPPRRGPSRSLNSRPENKTFIPVKSRARGGCPNGDSQAIRVIPAAATPSRSRNSIPPNAARPLVVEQIIRPTGLLDPVITLRPLKGQIDETIELCRQRVERGERVLVTTLTKKTAEDLSEYLRAWASRCATSTPTSTRSSGWRSCASCAPPTVRHPGRHQPAARGPRPAGGLAGLHPRRRQGGLPAQRDLA
jgi:excinuclease ABC subunit B